MVADGDKLWRYDIDLEQVTVQRYDPLHSSTPAQLLSGDIDQLVQAYEIQSRRQGKDWVFSLTPKQAGLFEGLQVTFRGGQLVSMRIDDGLDQRTDIDFGDIRVNAVIDPKQFSFTPPEGVDVLSDD